MKVAGTNEMHIPRLTYVLARCPCIGSNYASNIGSVQLANVAKPYIMYTSSRVSRVSLPTALLCSDKTTDILTD
jgi:hypothetical protein